LSGRYLLDTSIAIAVLNGAIDLAARLGPGSEIEIYLSPIVIGELCFGAEKSDRRDENLAAIQRPIDRCPTLACTEVTGRHYARLRHGLKEKGRPIPENDLWIAATAREHGLVLVTGDRHFDDIEDLKNEAW